MDDIELYEFFKDFSCNHFSLNYNHDAHCWNIQYGNREIEISKEDLLKLELYLKEFRLKYIPEPEPNVLKYIPD